MSGLSDLLAVGRTVSFVAVAIIAVCGWWRRRHVADAWVAATFATLAAVVVVGYLLPDGNTSAAVRAVRTAALSSLALFPYLLYRFAATFRRPSRLVELTVTVLTVAAAGAILLGGVPRGGEPSSALVPILFQWIVLIGIVAVRFWRAGRGRPTVSRRRMRTMSLGAVAITLALAVAAAPSTNDPQALRIVTDLLAVASAPLFLVGFSPPAAVLAMWRRPEASALRDAERGLMVAMSERGVAEVLLPHVSQALGGSGAVLTGRDGSTLAAFGVTTARAHELAAAIQMATGNDRAHHEPTVVAIALDEGGLAVEADPYTPYFGTEETEVLKDLASLTDLALRRARLSQRERDFAAELERTNRATREFVAVASHDLRTPITTIRGFARLLQQTWATVPDEDKLAQLAAIERQSGHLAQLVNDLLTVSKIDASALGPDRRPVGVARLVEQVISDLPSPAGVTADIPPELVVNADPDHLVRMLRNLIDNALSHGREPIRVGASTGDGTIAIRVCDAGDGVPEDFQPRLFERFARAETPRGRKRGTGLGLAIVRGLAQAGGGDAWYRPDETGGACFVVQLPKVREET